MKFNTTIALRLLLLLCPVAPAAAATTEAIDVGGHKIVFHVTSGHLPAIVLDAGGGLDSSYWDGIVPELAERTGAEIITYDRAGSGDSDEVPGPWSLQKATNDLELGLKKLGATHGTILVSHSLAGEIATTLASRHPDWLAGAVLADANVPELFTADFIAASSAAYAPVIAEIKAAPPTKAGRQLLALSASWKKTQSAFHKATWPNAVPVIVIVSEKTPLDSPEGAQWWRDAHAQFAKKANNRTLVTADGSSHDVAHDRPDAIINAVLALTAQVPRNAK